MKRPTRYVGMIGSRRKTRLILDHLKAKGFEEAALNSVHAPIGVTSRRKHLRRSRSSIVAELIEVRRKA